MKVQVIYKNNLINYLKESDKIPTKDRPTFVPIILAEYKKCNELFVFNMTVKESLSNLIKSINYLKEVSQIDYEKFSNLNNYTVKVLEKEAEVSCISFTNNICVYAEIKFKLPEALHNPQTEYHVEQIKEHILIKYEKVFFEMFFKEPTNKKVSEVARKVRKI